MKWVFVALCVAATLPPPRQMTEVRYISTSSRYNPKYISHLSVSVAKDPHGLDVDVNLTQTIESNYFAFIDIQIRLQDSTRYQSLFTEDFDVCKMARNINLKNLMKLWYQNVIKYGNFMDTCPVKPGFYIIRGMLVDPESLPMYLRPGDYRIVGQGYYKLGNDQHEPVVDGHIEIKWIS